MISIHRPALTNGRQPKGMSLGCVREKGPVHGPYAEAWYDELEQVHRVRLTEEGRAKVADYLKRYPHPIGLLISSWPRTYRAARAARLSNEEIESLCLEGVALAFARYDPTRGSVGTAIAWSIRASVGDAVRSAQRAMGHSVPGDGERLSTKGITANVHSPILEDERAEELNRCLAVAKLTFNERSALAHRYGLTGRPPLTCVAIGLAMGLSKERVRQLLEQAMRKLRRAIGLDGDWAATARGRILAYLSSLQCSSAEIVHATPLRERIAATKREICASAKVPNWQFREVISQLIQNGLVVRERRLMSRERWCIVFRVRSIAGGSQLGNACTPESCNCT
jgi:RNA polymerase sigma factor (sigma-70 family)